MFNKHDTTLDKTFMLLVYLFMVGLILIMVFPFWDQVVMSFSTRADALKGGVRIWTWPLNLEGYKSVLQSRELALAFLNTVFRVLAGTAWTVVLTAAMAYPLSRPEFPLKGTLTAIILFTMLFGGGLIPTYLLYKSLGLLDKRLALILPGVSAYNVIIMRNFFQSLPRELQEAAQLDGASDVRLWWSVVLPLSTPVLATIALWTAVAHWNAYFDVLIYITDRTKYTLQIILRRVLLEDQLAIMHMSASPDAMNTMPTPLTIKAALLIVTTLPVVLVYPFLQRYFIKGIILGSLKG